MRLSTSFAQQQAIETIHERQTQMLRTQEQIATGRRLTTPSEDPVAAAEAERLRSRESRLSVEMRTVSYARHLLSGAETALGDATDVLNAARDTLLAAGNGAVAPADRAKYGAQLREMREQLLMVANRSDGADGYVFGGQGGTVPPIDPAGTAYAPLAGVQELGNEVTNPVTLDGRENFIAIRTATGTESIFARLDVAIAALEDGTLAQTDLASTVNGVIDSVDRATARLSTTRTIVGERLRGIDAHELALENGSIEAQTRLSSLVDLDFARGVSALVQHQTSYEAALKSYAQIARLSLFDYV
jgi:flagellar hook-associated protein 3 FlgL